MRVTENSSKVLNRWATEHNSLSRAVRGDISQEEFRGLTNLTRDKESKMLIPSNLDVWESSNTIKKN